MLYININIRSWRFQEDSKKELWNIGLMKVEKNMQVVATNNNMKEWENQ